MFGQNVKRKPFVGNGENLQIQEIFPTIQGEGPFVGQPSVFVRLGGCNLACDFCDTEFESFKDWNLTEILAEIEKFSLNSNGTRSRDLVVITGGEPFRQPIELLIEKLLEMNFRVQIETNGTIFRNINKKAHVVCSPKNTNGVYFPIAKEILSLISAFKFILSKTHKNYSTITEIGQKEYNIPVYVQPMDEQDEQKNAENTEFARKFAEENGHILSLQIHKILNIK